MHSTRVHRNHGVAFATALAAIALSLGARADDLEVYRAWINGAQEVPPVATDARGRFFLRIDELDDHDDDDDDDDWDDDWDDDKHGGAATSARYVLIVALVSNVTAAHLHMAPTGTNGPVVVSLFNGQLLGTVNGVLSSGTITSNSLVGPLAGQGIQALKNAMDAGRIYVNVHTVQNPSGEMRGQVLRVGSAKAAKSVSRPVAKRRR
ncbi:MAG TPA: CHRD domain-containing protein [Kiritimatiellia bacterium]|jgi:hypothetical protein